MISARVYAGGSAKEIESEAISDVVGTADQLLWVHATKPTEDDLACLAKEFGLHPLAIEDIRERHQRPKLEHYPSHSFLVAYSAGLAEMELCVGPGWVITVCDGTWNPGEIAKRFERTRTEHASVGFFVYLLLDEVVDGYFTAAEAMEEDLEDLEEQIFSEELAGERAAQQELFGARRRLLVLRRHVAPLRDVVASLLRREADWVDDATATHLQDVYDHVLRAVDLLDNQRELMGNAVEAHLAVISNRMNEVMKTMTSWGAILLGSTLIAGIYGMNFANMPELDWRLGYPFALGLMALITIVGFRSFRRKDWL